MIMTQNKTDISDNLRHFRKSKGMSQDELGKRAFPDYRAAFAKINKLETGQQKATEDDIRLLAEILEIDENDLTSQRIKSGFVINPKLFEIAPKLKHYFDLLNHTVELGDIAPKLIAATIYEMGNDPDIQEILPKHDTLTRKAK